MPLNSLHSQESHGLSYSVDSPSLILQCFEEPLSVSQVRAFNNAQKAYLNSVKQIEEAKREAELSSTIIIVSNATPEQTFASENDTSAEIIRQSRSPSPDVIIIDEPQQFHNLSKTNKAVKSANKPVSKKRSRTREQVINLDSESDSSLTDECSADDLLVNDDSEDSAAAYESVPSVPFRSLLPPPKNIKKNVIQKIVNEKKKNKKIIHAKSSLFQDKMKKLKLSRKEENHEAIGNWIPLTEYYYSKQEGDPSYSETKGEFRFRCWYCHKMLYNNVKIVEHMQKHFQSEFQPHVDLSDHTQCKKCFMSFDRPFEMQQHYNKIHGNNFSMLVCQICEKNFQKDKAMREHMKLYHNACEMPYGCNLCNFKSSYYDDILDHFKKRHDSSQNLLCLFCLKTFKISFSETNGFGLTQSYYQHLQKHFMKTHVSKCSSCRLTFTSKFELLAHKKRDHLPNYKVAPSTNQKKRLTEKNVDLLVNVPSLKTGFTKSLNVQDPMMQDLKSLQFHQPPPGSVCLECKSTMTFAEHFKKFFQCPLCRYLTACNSAYANHMTGFHNPNKSVRSKNMIQPKPLQNCWHCICGFSSQAGNKIANHLAFCSKSSCYLKIPTIRYLEYDDEKEEFMPQIDEEHDQPKGMRKVSTHSETIFDALNSLKSSGISEPKSVSKTQIEESAVKSEIIVSSVLTKMVDKICIDFEKSKPLLQDTPEIPEHQLSELCGPKKWSMVKIKVPEAPSKNSIFLGE